MDPLGFKTLPFQSTALEKKIEDLSHGAESKKLTTDDASQVKKACADMESLFIYYLLKEMRATVPKTGYMDGGKGEEVYTSMLDSQLAKEMAAERGIGLSRLLYENLAVRSEKNK